MRSGSDPEFSGPNRRARRQVGEPAWETVECPNRRPGLEVVDLDSGELGLGRCGRRDCPVCLRIDVGRVIGAIRMARPENSIRLSVRGADPGVIVSGMRDLRRWWRKNVGPWEDVYAIEANPGGGGLHLHGWQYGSPVDRGDLEVAADKTGFLPGPYGQPIRHQEGLGYLLKQVSGPPSLTMPTEALEFLALNNTLVHKSKGFWRDWDGNPIKRQDDAVRLARNRTRPRRYATTTVGTRMN